MEVDLKVETVDIQPEEISVDDQEMNISSTRSTSSSCSRPSGSYYLSPENVWIKSEVDIDEEELTPPTESTPLTESIPLTESTGKKRQTYITGRKISKIWNHFNAIGENRAICKYCWQILSVSGGSSGNLIRHLRNKHVSVKVDSPYRPIACKKKTIRLVRSEVFTEGQSSSPAPTSTMDVETSNVTKMADDGIQTEPIPSCSDHHPQPSDLLFSSFTDVADVLKPLSTLTKKQIDNQLLKIVCNNYKHFSFVEGTEFRNLLALLCPSYVMPSRKDLSHSLLPQMYYELVEVVKAKVSKATQVALAIDRWTSINNKCYAAMTVYYLDESTSLCTNFLECIEFSQQHTPIELASILEKHCIEWKIHDKLLAVVTDNSPSMVTAVKLNKWKHISCFAQELNSIVSSSIKPIESLVNKVKNIVQYFKMNSFALSKLKDIQEKGGFPHMKLKQNSPTCWISTFEMLKRVFINKASVQSALEVLGYQNEKISPTEWTVIEQTISILQVFDEVAKEVSAEKILHLSKCFILTRNLLHYLSKFSKKENSSHLLEEICSNLISKISEKFIQNETSDLGLINQALIFDPRFKNIVKNVEGYKINYDPVVEEIKNLVSYELVFSSTSDPDVPVQSTPPSSFWKAFDKKIAKPAAERNDKIAILKQLEYYLAEPTLHRSFDLLNWWEQMKHMYHHLYPVALKRLCIPATSVPCERIFTKEGKMVTEQRSHLETSKLSKMLFINFNS